MVGALPFAGFGNTKRMSSVRFSAVLNAEIKVEINAFVLSFSGLEADQIWPKKALAKR